MQLPLIALLVSMVSLAGCFGGDDGPARPDLRDPRTVEIDLIIQPDSVVPLYTLNDGERLMNVTAMGFQLAGDDRGLTVPGPQLRVLEGDTVIIRLINSNALPHTFHLHGNLDDWEDDGVPFVSQMPIHSGQEHEYVFEDIKAGTYWYHCHVDVAHHIDLGMYGAFIVEEREPTYEAEDLPEHVLMFDEWDNCHVHQGSIGPVDPRTREGSANYNALPECAQTVILDTIAQNFAPSTGGAAVPDAVKDPACEAYQDAMDDPTVPQELKDAIEPVLRQLNCDDGHRVPPPQQSVREWYFAQFPNYVPNYNTYLINGKAFPDTKPILFEEGKTYRMRLINVGEEMHSLHIHGHSMLVTHRDGFELSAPFRVDTLGIMPGERYDVLVEADNPGFWVFHDHVGLSVMNDDQAPGGMFTMIGYQGFLGQEWDPQGRSIELMEFTYNRLLEGGGHGHGGEA